MNRAIVGLLVMTGVAHADRISAPAGWQSKPEQAAELAAKQRRLSHFGGAPTDIAVVAYVPGEPGIVLYATTITAPATAATAVRVEVTDHKAPGNAAGVEVSDSGERVSDATREIESRLAMRDRAAQLLTVSRMVIAADAKRVVEVTGDCIARDDIAKNLLDVCTKALATLDPEIAAADRVPVSLAAAQTAPAPSGDLPPLSPHLHDDSRIGTPPIMAPGSPVDRPSESQSDRRPLYLGAGLVVLALVFWWNRRRREKFEREDAAEGGTDEAGAVGPSTAPARGEAPAEPEKSGDADADDLHAAAEPKPKDDADDR